ncbi:velvet factor-domain-containing protein [Chaetomium sp. MPI-SDFR-AT-0129]|nr:velvet factor-domain-containing protein [Chaetomium sp. MPI-SDFR-AT-0129]
MGAPILASAAHAIPALEAGDNHPMDIGTMTSRETRDGRRLWYRMRIIQQPERARACGSGLKSSADRRPVDPPPVVELRIYEGPTWEVAQDKDITFVYNANFFLYATLQHARLMAHARGATSSTNTPPVLTGMPVSGMAYLDRPQEAGYFLFPDLSVRHEGRYKLSFNLYEETKEDKDRDKEEEGEPQQLQTYTHPAMAEYFDFRMEIKSQEFIVYSAKKFPGLAESTTLSRVVADQGCRVRIRREPRMRRRDAKPGGDYDHVDGAAEYERKRRTATPDNRAVAEYNRARSMSGSTERTPYSADPARRPSMADYPSPYSQNPPPGGHLQFLGGNAGSQFPAAPPPPPQSFAQPQPQSQPQPPSVPASPVYPPTQAASYPAPTSYQAVAKAHSRERTPSQSGYPPINPAPPRSDSIRHEHRASGSVQLPPLSSIALPPRLEPSQVLPPIQVDRNYAASSTSRLGVSSPTNYTTAPRSGPSLAPLAPLINNPVAKSGPVHPGVLPPPTMYAGSKRAHGDSFRSDPDTPRFQDGARETARGDDISMEELNATFKRANGQLAYTGDLRPF